MAHEGIGDGDPFTRMQNDGYQFSNAGENIAWNQQTVAAVMTAWMDVAGAQGEHPREVHPGGPGGRLRPRPLLDSGLRDAVDAWPHDAGDTIHRAGGDVRCKQCGKLYYGHLRAGPVGYDGEQFLRRLCDGRLVKL